MAAYIESTDWLDELPPFRRDSGYIEREESHYRWLVRRMADPDRVRTGSELTITEAIDYVVSTALTDFADTDSADENDVLAEAIVEERLGNYGGESDIGPALRRFLRREIFFAAFRHELHKLLCSKDEASAEQRERILRQSNTRQSGVAVTIASMIAPALGTSAGMIAGAVPVALAMIGRVSLSAWCAMQTSAATGRG